jgi:hypothetical protein
MLAIDSFSQSSSPKSFVALSVATLFQLECERLQANNYKQIKQELQESRGCKREEEESEVGCSGSSSGSPVHVLRVANKHSGSPAHEQALQLTLREIANSRKFKLETEDMAWMYDWFLGQQIEQQTLSYVKGDERETMRMRPVCQKKLRAVTLL